MFTDNVLKPRQLNTGSGTVSQTQMLRVQATYSYVCSKAGISVNGNQMEMRFGRSAENRTGIFNKHLNYQVKPSLDTILRIDEEISGVVELYYSPIWKAIESVECNEQNIDLCLENQDLDVLLQLFDTEREYCGSLTRKSVHKKTIKKLRHIASDSTVASLILIRLELEYHPNDASFGKKWIDKHLIETLLNTFACQMLPDAPYGLDILNLLKTSFSWEKHEAYSQLFNEDSVRKFISEKMALLTMITKLRRSSSKKENLLFLNLLDLGDTTLIDHELTFIDKNAATNQSFILEQANKHGLLWALSKINLCCGEIDRFKIQKIEGKPVIQIPHH